MGPRQTQVEARVSEKSGNIRTTLTMAFPYCDACARRARWERVRQVVVGVAAGLVGVGLAFAAWRVDVGVGASIRFALALPLAMVLAALVALLTQQSLPAPPATARGEAVILRDTSGTVLCTNPQFAQLLAQANGGTARPGAQRMTVEVWAPLLALAVGLGVTASWIKVGAPEGTAAASTSLPATTKAAGPPASSPAQPNQPPPGQPAQAKRAVPTAVPAAKKR
jgi:hypothetical protein